MTEKELVKRWETEDGLKKLDKVIECLTKNETLSKVRGIEKYCGRWDLRGSKLSSVARQRIIEADGYKTVQKSGTLKLIKIKLESVDFSYADISCSYLKNCNVFNCMFEKTEATNLEVVACDFSHSIFRKANIANSFLNMNFGSNSGSFKHTEFIESNLSKCIFYFPVIENCFFDNCKMKEVDFDGSRFKNCKFKGEIVSSWFRGYSIHGIKSIVGLFKKVNLKNYPNRMENVDFSEVKLDGISFSHAINLSKCKFPNNGNYILVKDLRKIYVLAKDMMKKKWSSEEARLGINIINNVYYDMSHQDQYMDLIDKHMILKYSKSEKFGERFFDLIKSLNNENS